MDTTSVSLLERLRGPDEAVAWSRFVELYAPLVHRWARRTGLQEADAADLTQDVFAALVRKLPEFRYDRGKSFRGWLKTVTLNLWRDRVRKRRPSPLDGTAPELADLAVPDELADAWDREHNAHLAARALQLMQAEFQPATWKACWEHVVNGRPAAEVAAELGMTENAVYIARCRVLRRLRQELDGLLD
jgi:RNA polymerase sigma-70 factor (ECF subfamily)